MSKYEPSFKEEAVRLALSSSQTIAQTARDLGIKESSLYNWISQKKQNSHTIAADNGDEVNLVDELNRLRKQVARLEEERAILKKATQFFAKETR